MHFNKLLKGKKGDEPPKQSVDSQGKGTAQSTRKLVSGLTDAFRKTSLGTNADYRQFFLASDVSQARIVIAFLTLALALFSISDYMFFAFSLEFYALSALRLGLIAYSILQIRFIGRVKNYRSYDRSTFIYLLTMVIGILIVNTTRPLNFLSHVIIIDVAVFVFYLVIPIRFIFQALPSLILTLGEILIIMVSFGSFTMPAVLTALLSLIFVNIVAMLTSLQVHSYRWWIFQDVLERRDTERLAAIGQTAGMIGHDIRNPLQAITSELYLAKESVSTLSDLDVKVEVLESIDLVEEQTDYISKIVSDLQDYARPLKPEYTEIVLSDLVVSVFQTIHIPDKILLKIDVKGFPKIKTDPTLMKRTLTNLVNNGVQAMPNGGTLELIAYTREGKAVITVSDTGKGIAEEIKPKLFTPLVTTKAKGHGFGLAVVKRIVEALHGTITFESQEGKGTKFIIQLPLENQ